MNLAQAITQFGGRIGAVGIAVLTFTVTNPGCTYDQIAEGLSMGRSTVIKYVHILEEANLVSRHTDKNAQGMHLATTINSGVYLIDTDVHVIDTVGQRAPINTGVQQIDTDKNRCPAGIHRESTPLHPHKDILNTKTLSAKKQQREAKAKPDKNSDSTKDPRTKFPAIVAFRDVTTKNPKPALYDKVIEILGDHPNITKMRECWMEWQERGYNERSLKWLTEWYVNGIPTQFRVVNGGNNGQPSINQHESTNLQRHRENHERFVRPRTA